MSVKYAQQSVILTYQIFCALKPLIITGVTWLFTSRYQQTFRKIHYINWLNYPHTKKLVCMLLYVIIQ